MATSNADGPIKISKRIEKELHQTKVVLRRLPPDFTEDKLLEMLPDIPPYNFSYFVAGDPILGNLSFSRAYFSFTDEASILPFRDKYDGIHLESEKGAKYRAVIEFAPCQSVPKRQKRKPDARMGTIEQDSDYKSFLETSEEKVTPPTMNELAAYIDTIGTNKVSGVQKTPLISYLLESRKGVRSGKRPKSSSDSKKKYGKESTKPSKESRKDAGGSKGSSRDSKAKIESKERPERSKEISSPGASSKDRPASSERHREKSRGSREKRGQPRCEENGEAQTEGERMSKEARVKNKDRPDQVVYSPQGRQRNHDRDRNDYKESGRSKDRDKESSQRHSSSSKESTSEYRSGRGGGREYNYEEKPRRGHGDDYSGSSKERRDGRGDDYSGSSKERRDGRGDDYSKERRDGRGDDYSGSSKGRGGGYRKPRDSYYDQDSKTHSSGHREK